MRPHPPATTITSSTCTTAAAEPSPSYHHPHPHPHHDNDGLSSFSGLQDYSPPDDNDNDNNLYSMLLDGDDENNDVEGVEVEGRQDGPEGGGGGTTQHRQATAALVRNIASFMTISDAASLASRQRNNSFIITTPVEDDDDDSWRGYVGGGIGASRGGGAEDSSWSLATTPPTPGLVAISPGATPGPNTAYHHHVHMHMQDFDDDEDEDEGDVDIMDDEEDDDSMFMQQLLRERRRQWAQGKLASAVLTHPLPLRAYCLDAYQAAQDICRQEREQALLLQQQQQQATLKADGEADPETWVEPCCSNDNNKQQHQPTTTSATAHLHKQRMMTKSHHHHHHNKDRRLELLHELIDLIFHNVPVSVTLDVVDALGSLTLDTSYATVRICINSVNGTFSAIVYLAAVSWDAVVNFNPFHFLEMMISLQFNAMGKTSEVLVSGIQSVTTGVESASSMMALHRLSAANLNRSGSFCGPGLGAGGGGAASSAGVGASVGGGSGHHHRHHHHHQHHDYSFKQRNHKLVKKMSSINDAARVVAYREHPDDTGGGLTRQAISRTRRMMHYSVSLRPFVATVAVKTLPVVQAQLPPPSSSPAQTRPAQPQQQRQVQSSQASPPQLVQPVDDRLNPPDHAAATTSAPAASLQQDPSSFEYGGGRGTSSSINVAVVSGEGFSMRGTEDASTSSPLGDHKDEGCISPYGSIGANSMSNTTSPLICSPQSFPPTPRSRRMVLARGSQFADDVVFLARDRLRVHGGLESRNERTREMAWALKEGKRLAIFENPNNSSSNNNSSSSNLGIGGGLGGIELKCGQHIATKVGNMHYASTRSMVPVLRNCYVYFEITVMPTLLLSAASLDPNAQQEQQQHQHVVVAPPVTLSIGLSTLEMPPNTLVGSWQGSVGLCTTGQILMAGQWLLPNTHPADPSQVVVGAYGYGATVGCLVFLDDASSFETWDGAMVHASVRFSINGLAVPPPTLVTHSHHHQAGVGVGVGNVCMSSHASAAAASATAPSGHHHHHAAASTALLSPPHHRPSSQQLGLPSVVVADSTTTTTTATSASSMTMMTPTLLVPASEELYPTVTLQTPATAVMCRFSSEDVIYANASNLFGVGGAPRGATVYAVDGSVIYSPDYSNSTEGRKEGITEGLK